MRHITRKKKKLTFSIKRALASAMLGKILFCQCKINVKFKKEKKQKYRGTWGKVS